MFITKRKYEKDLKKARKHGYRKALMENDFNRRIEYIERNVYDMIDRICNRLEKFENETCDCKSKEK